MKPADPFVFIVGAQRSGTTLLRAMLDTHPQLSVPPESRFMIPLARRQDGYRTSAGFDHEAFLNDLSAHPRFVRWGLDMGEVRRSLLAEGTLDLPAAIRLLYRMYAKDRGKTRYGDKTPGYVRFIPALARMFPEARFVHLIRDGRDVAMSLLALDWGPDSVIQAGWYWKERVTLGRRDGTSLGETRYQEVRYEDLVADPEATLQRLCRFAELEFDPAMLDYTERADELLASDKHPQQHQRLHLPPTKDLRTWRRDMTVGQLAGFEAVAADLLVDLGYELGSRRIPFTKRVHATGAWLRGKYGDLVGRARRSLERDARGR